MRRPSSISALAALAGLVIVSACSPETLGPHDKTVIFSEVPEFLGAWQAAGNEGRLDDLKAFYSPYTDFTWVEQGKVAYDSAQAVADGLDALEASGATSRLALGAPIVKALARDAAAVTATYTLTLTLPPDTVVETAGVFTGVVKREESGWVFVQGHFSSPLPEPPAQDPVPEPGPEPEPAVEPAPEPAPAETPVPN